MCVPGIGLQGRSWERTFEALRHAGPVAARVVPLPGLGAPASPAVDLSPRHQANRVLSALTGDESFVLAGHSAGCQVAAWVAALAPDRVRALVLVGPSTDSKAATWPRLIGRWLATAAHERPDQLPALARQYGHTRLRTMRRTMNRVRYDLVDETVKTVRCPVVVVRGQYDRIAPADWCRRVAEAAGADVGRHPLSRSVTLDGGGHMVPWTRPEQLARELRTAL